jgi:hypothetical protein
MKEFNDTAKPYEKGDELIFDLRPFGTRQGEAADSYLHERAWHSGTTGIGNTDKLVVLLCDSTAAVPSPAGEWLKQKSALLALSWTMWAARSAASSSHGII